MSAAVPKLGKSTPLFGVSRLGKLADKFVSKSVQRYMRALWDDAVDTFGLEEVYIYMVAVFVISAGSMLWSDRQFSAILTFAAAVQLLGFVFMLQEVNRNGNFSGLSVRMLMFYVPVYCFRLTSTLIEEGYLPVDRSGDWCYQLADVAALSLVFVLLWKSWKNPTAPKETFPVWPVVIGCFLFAVIVHPCQNLGTWTDVCWSTAVYLDVFTMMPQLQLARNFKNVTGLTSNSIMCTAVYRILNWWFWFTSRRELMRVRCPTVIPSYFIVGALFLQILLLADFVFYYAKALVYKTEIPSCFSAVVAVKPLGAIKQALQNDPAPQLVPSHHVERAPMV